MKKKKIYKQVEQLPKNFTDFKYSGSRFVAICSLRKGNENSGSNEKDLDEIREKTV